MRIQFQHSRVFNDEVYALELGPHKCLFPKKIDERIPFRLRFQVAW